MYRIAIAVLSSVSCLGQQAPAAEPPKPLELKVLEKFVGTWDCEIVTKPAVWTPKESQDKAVEVNEMTMDGWFLHGCSKTPDGKTLLVMMNTYDPAAKKFHFWRFAGRGCEEMDGRWDDLTSTLTITTDQGNGITTTAAFHVIDKDRREYHVTAKDGDGKIYLDIHGAVTRRK
jgi:hypothetical protein